MRSRDVKDQWICAVRLTIQMHQSQWLPQPRGYRVRRRTGTAGFLEIDEMTKRTQGRQSRVPENVPEVICRCMTLC